MLNLALNIVYFIVVIIIPRCALEVRLKLLMDSLPIHLTTYKWICMKHLRC